jgi:hypothetical protein
MLEGLHTCTPGGTVRVACSTRCGLGSCTGDSILRACDVSAGLACTGAVEIGSNDDSGCGGGDLCSQMSFTCPASGRYNVFRGAYDSGLTATCTLGIVP